MLSALAVSIEAAYLGDGTACSGHRFFGLLVIKGNTTVLHTVEPGALPGRSTIFLIIETMKRFTCVYFASNGQ
jgi:hypothetical protein